MAQKFCSDCGHALQRAAAHTQAIDARTRDRVGIRLRRASQARWTAVAASILALMIAALGALALATHRRVRGVAVPRVAVALAAAIGCCAGLPSRAAAA